MNSEELKYILISIGSIFMGFCCINIFKKCYKRYHNQNSNKIKIEKLEVVPSSNDKLSSINTQKHKKIEIVSENKNSNKYKLSQDESTSCRPYNHIRDEYINELIQEYISNNKKKTESEIRIEYNYFRTPEDILKFKNNITNLNIY